MSAIANGIKLQSDRPRGGVTLKERRRLVLMFENRRCILGHLRSHGRAGRNGCDPGAAHARLFYLQPQTVADIVEHSS